MDHANGKCTEDTKRFSLKFQDQQRQLQTAHSRMKGGKNAMRSSNVRSGHVDGKRKTVERTNLTRTVMVQHLTSSASA